jgi:pimeloyl-ACP methyl ester carboxylesterase
MTLRMLAKVLFPFALLLFVLAAAAAVRVKRVKSRGLLGYPYSRPPLSSAEYAALAAQPGWKQVEVPAAPQSTLLLRGLVRPPKTAGAPWVLFFQGNSKRLLAEGQEFLQVLAGQADVGLALVSWRGFDGSPGDPGRDVLLADANAAVHWLRANGAGGAPLHIIGFSLGTMPAVAAALDSQLGPEAARSLTLLAPFTAMQMYEAGKLKRWTAAEDWDLLPLLALLKVPLLVVHGTADQTLPVAMGREIARTAQGRLVEVPGAGHLDLMNDERALSAVRAVVLSR